MAAVISRLVRIEGRVQGVGFRQACVHEARALGVAGYVRNLNDGCVEAMLQGPDDAVARLLAWLRHGPPAARVERITESPASPAVERMARFEIRSTA